MGQEEEEDCVDGIRWISVEDLLFFNRSLIERYTPHETPGTISRNALESAQMRPAQHRYWSQTNDVIYLASVLLTAIIQNHPFHNANKRTAFVACRVFLHLNGACFDPPRDEAIQMCLEVAQKRHEIQEVAWWMARYTRPVQSGELLAGCLETSSADLEVFVHATQPPYGDDNSSL